MVFGWHKNNVVVEMIEDYLFKAEECMEFFKQSMENYFQGKLSAEFDGLVEKTSIKESGCDDIRRKVEAAMYAKALIPESREDILRLLESVDHIPNKAESVLYMIQTEFLNIPDTYIGKFSQLVNINYDTFLQLVKAMRFLFKDTGKVQACTDDIDKFESSSDTLEHEIIKSLFADINIAPDQKILLRELVIELGAIADRCENASDTMTIITVKRLV